MPRGAAGGAAVFALTAWLAADNGGFDATTWNLALIVVCAVALVVALVDGGERPTFDAAVFVGALALLTAWTAISYFWSDAPPLALVEAQRVARQPLIRERRRPVSVWQACAVPLTPGYARARQNRGSEPRLTVC
jgi:hypothetical protein